MTRSLLPARAGFTFRSILLSSLIFLSSACSPKIRPEPRNYHSQTRWNISTSIAFEALAFLNGLTGDPLVGDHYRQDVDAFLIQAASDVKTALTRLAQFRDEKLHSNLSGFFSHYFLAAGAETLASMIDLVNRPESISKAIIAYDQSGIEMNVYYHQEGWQLFQDILPSLKTALVFLQEAGFPQYWEQKIAPDIQPDIQRIQGAVAGYDLIPLIEKTVGFSMPTDQVNIYLVHYVWPYGHHVLGTNFITIPADSDTGIIRTTIHELLHNPFNNTDPAFWKAANSLQSDPLIKGCFEGRDPKFGYNDWGNYVAEDSVRALEQQIESGLGLGERWAWTEDGGMHCLAAVLYNQMKNESFPQDGESYQAFLIRMVDEDHLAPGKLDAIYHQS